MIPTRRGMPPEEVARTLDPPDAALLKREEGTFVWRERGPTGDPRVVKLYRRRGRWNAMRCRVLGYRTEREHDHLLHLVRWGVPCTVPLAWGRGRSELHGNFEVLSLREVPEAIQLDRYLREGGGGLEPLYRAVRRMHESGFCHQTLYATNVLLGGNAEPDPGFFIADVPRSHVFPRSIVGTRMALYDLVDLTADIRRLGRSGADTALATYGLDAVSREVMSRLGQGDARSKRRRLLRDLEARVRWAGAWAAVWRGRDRPPPAEASGGEPA